MLDGRLASRPEGSRRTLAAYQRRNLYESTVSLYHADFEKSSPFFIIFSCLNISIQRNSKMPDCVVFPPVHLCLFNVHILA